MGLIMKQVFISGSQFLEEFFLAKQTLPNRKPSRFYVLALPGATLALGKGRFSIDALISSAAIR